MEAWTATFPGALPSADTDIPMEAKETNTDGSAAEADEGVEVLRVHSDGQVTIFGAVPRSFNNFSAMNKLLVPIGYFLRFDNSVATGEWFVHHRDSHWKEALVVDADVTVSAFPRREWEGVKAQLESLPADVPVGKTPRTDYHSDHGGSGYGGRGGGGVGFAFGGGRGGEGGFQQGFQSNGGFQQQLSNGGGFQQGFQMGTAPGQLQGGGNNAQNAQGQMSAQQQQMMQMQYMMMMMPQMQQMQQMQAGYAAPVPQTKEESSYQKSDQNQYQNQNQNQN